MGLNYDMTKKCSCRQVQGRANPNQPSGTLLDLLLAILHCPGSNNCLFSIHTPLRKYNDPPVDLNHASTELSSLITPTFKGFSADFFYDQLIMEVVRNENQKRITLFNLLSHLHDFFFTTVSV